MAMKLALGSSRSQSSNFAGHTRRVAQHFADNSHVTYYTGSRRTRQLVLMDASAGAWQPAAGGRRARMQKHIDEVSQLLNSLEEGGQKLASYDLLANLESGVSGVQKNLPSFDLQLNDFSGSSASSSSESSSSEAESSAMQMQKTTAAAASTAGIGMGMFDMPTRQHRPQQQVAVAQPAIERATITVCQGKHCRKQGSQEMLRVLQAKGAEHGLHVSGCKCLKQCERAPAVRVESADNERAVTYVQVANGALNHVITAALDEF